MGVDHTWFRLNKYISFVITYDGKGFTLGRVLLIYRAGRINFRKRLSNCPRGISSTSILVRFEEEEEEDEETGDVRISKRPIRVCIAV